jgi:hypothetical protein
MHDDEPIPLSVIVTVVGGKDFLPRCLRHLEAQAKERLFEILVPYDTTIKDIVLLQQEFPRVTFVDCGAPETEAPAGSLAAAHELYDLRRAWGLRAARGSIVAMLEDYEIPAASWCAQLLAAHKLPHGVIGGAVEHRGKGLLNWAVYFLDFGRYQLPLSAGPTSYLTDVNVSYKRTALELVRDLWARRYHEVTVHWALARLGVTLWRQPDIVVSQDRGRLSFLRTIGERFAWGRLFGVLRVRELTPAKRWSYVVLSPIIPAVVIGRLFRKVFGGGRCRLQFLAALPFTVLLSFVWCLGEVAGYVTGRAAASPAGNRDQSLEVGAPVFAGQGVRDSAGGASLADRR